MPRPRHVLLALIVTALLAVPAVALAASTVTAASYEAPDGTIFRVVAGAKLTDGAARYELKATAAGTTKVVTSADIKPARTKPLRVGSSLACADPGVSTAYGTVAREAKRVVATLVDGTKLRLSRTEPPSAWKYDGWLVAGIANSHSPVARVDVFAKSGKRLSIAKFSSPEGC
jgi:hypothetical protein